MQGITMCAQIFALLYLLYTPCQVAAIPFPVDCDSAKFSLEQQGFNSDPYLLKYEGLDPSVCGEGNCCTNNMQINLGGRSREELVSHHNKTLGDLAILLKSRALKFDELFKQMLNNSKQDFHEMFKKTYGVIYEQNSYVFTDLFQELEKYYAKGQVDLTEAMDEFFNTLYQKMFTVLNAGYTFNDKYLECVNDRMKELKPFGDVPSKLSSLLKRSFVATRTFAQALHVAGDIVSNMQNLTLTTACHQAYTKMTKCQACNGHGDIKPCSSYCTNVMKGCLAYHSQLEPQWNAFIDATDKVVDRLLGPFNIEMVVEPIDIKISEAIMNFQENAQQVSQRVFSECGKPMLGRNKRDNGEIEFETLDFSNRGNGGMDEGRGGRDGGSGTLENIIKETRKVLKNTKGFWYKLPYHMCNEKIVATNTDSCWNGKAKDRYLKEVAGDGFSNQVKNPEFSVDISQQNSLVNEQIYALKVINNKLKSAHNGMDVDWIDNEEFEGSGSGSGDGIVPVESGSGESPTEIPESSSYPTYSKSTPPNEDTNQEPNEIPKIPNFGISVNSTRTQMTTGSSSRISKAAISFIVPIIMVSFGNSLIDWVQ